MTKKALHLHQNGTGSLCVFFFFAPANCILQSVLRLMPIANRIDAMRLLCGAMQGYCSESLVSSINVIQGSRGGGYNIVAALVYTCSYIISDVNVFRISQSVRKMLTKSVPAINE